MTSAPVKIPSGVPGFDDLALGGIPSGRFTLVLGTSGAGKTLFGSQFLAEAIRNGKGAVFVTFEESPEDIRENLHNLGLDVPAWEEQGLWRFIDGSQGPEAAEVGEYDLAGVIARIAHVVKTMGATRVVVDSLDALHTRFPRVRSVREQVHNLAQALRRTGATVILTGEAARDSEGASRYGVEEYASDNVIILRNRLDDEQRRRTVEILKFRGHDHRKGEVSYAIRDGEGLIVAPLLGGVELDQTASRERDATGVRGLDDLLGGGFLRGSSILLSGTTGTGKTAMVLHLLGQAARDGRKAVLFAFEEGRDQLERAAEGWGLPFMEHERSGALIVRSVYPEAKTLEEHLIDFKHLMDTEKPKLLVVDSLTAVERMAGERAFREFMLGVISYARTTQTTVVFIATARAHGDPMKFMEMNVSTLADTILLMRYLERDGAISRVLTVFKMRATAHDRRIWVYDITEEGLVVRHPLEGVEGAFLKGHGGAEEDDHMSGPA